MCGSSASKPYGRSGSWNAIALVLLGSGRRVRGCLSFLAPPADDGRKDRNEDYRQHQLFDVLVDSGNIRAEEIPGEQHAPYPEYRSEHTDQHELTVRHLSD